MTAVTYRRSATENQEWLDDQEADCRRYADEHGLTITRVFTDIGRSHAGIDHLIATVEEGGVADLIVTDLARLGFRIADHLAVVQRLHDAGIDIHVTKEQMPNTQASLRLGVKQAYTEADSRLDHPLCNDEPGD